MVETDAMSQIDIDNTCYVGDRSCNDGSHREGGSTIEIDLKFIRAGGWSQKKERFVDGHCHSYPKRDVI